MSPLPLLLPCLLAAAPEPGPLQEFRMPTGLRVVLEERHERPLLRLELRVAGMDSRGGCALLGGVLGRCGAGGFPRPALERALADRGLKLALEVRSSALAWSLLADSQDQEEAFAFLAHSVFRPDLAEGVAAVRQEPARSVPPEEAFREALGFPAEGAADGAPDLRTALALQRRLVRPERAVLLVQGDLNLAQARQLAQLHFGTWAPSPEPSAPAEGAAPPFAVRRLVPGGEKAAWAGSGAPGGEARARAAHVFLAILLERAFPAGTGGPFAAEAARPDGDAGPILFRALGPAGPDPEASLRGWLERLGSRGFSPAELEGARRQWRAERAALVLHPERQLAARASQCLQGDPGAFLEEVRLEEVNAALRARIAPQALHWLVRGD